jgi:hypothetical protein
LYWQAAILGDVLLMHPAPPVVMLQVLIGITHAPWEAVHVPVQPELMVHVFLQRRESALKLQLLVREHVLPLAGLVPAPLMTRDAKGSLRLMSLITSKLQQGFKARTLHLSHRSGEGSARRGKTERNQNIPIATGSLG